VVTDSRIDVSPNIDSYFAEVVEDAIRVRRVDATDATKQYLAGLLGDYARGAVSMSSLEQPLTLQLQDALEQTGAERFERLRRIGDGVLYALGFFGNCFTRRGADPHYVKVLGSSAYGHAAAMLRLAGGGSVPDVLRELAERYGRFVEVMSEIADGTLAAAADQDSSVVRIYERWQQTGSDRLAGELAQLGLCPVRGVGGVH
jgi:hypothetical protein